MSRVVPRFESDEMLPLMFDDIRPAKSSKVGVDIDDVLHPWFTTAHKLCEAAGITNGVTPASWTPHEEYGCELDVWRRVIDQAVLDGGLYDVPPIEGTVEAIRHLMWEGHEIHLVSARGTGWLHSREIKLATRHWLEEYAVPRTSLTFTGGKVRRAKQLQLDYFIDDAVHNFQALELAGVNVYLQSAPHNLDFWTPARVESVREFADMILEEAS
jgi:5'(3')-deoxyribonucleotidase